MSERETALKVHADPDMGHGWFVTAGRWGDAFVTIEERCLSGKPEFTPEDEALIRGAALHLLAFIGSPAHKHAPQTGYERCEWCNYSFIPTRRGKQRQRFCCPHCAQSWLAANREADIMDRLKAQARAIEAILRASGCPSMTLPEGVQWLANRVPEAAGADPVPVCQWREIATAPKDADLIGGSAGDYRWDRRAGVVSGDAAEDVAGDCVCGAAVDAGE